MGMQIKSVFIYQINKNYVVSTNSLEIKLLFTNKSLDAKL